MQTKQQVLMEYRLKLLNFLPMLFIPLMEQRETHKWQYAPYNTKPSEALQL